MEIQSLILSPETDDDDELDEPDEVEEPPTAVCAERPREHSLFDLEGSSSGLGSGR